MNAPTTITNNFAQKARATWDGTERRRECDPTFTLDRQIAEARRDMGPERWEQLKREWNEGAGR